MEWNKLVSEDVLSATIKTLNANGISTIVVENGEEAKRKALELIPEKAEVFTVTSTTVNDIGLAKEINESGKYVSVRDMLNDMDRRTQGREMARIGAAPDWVVGSVHAVTESGNVIIASQTGSQLSAYAHGAQHVIWIVGTQKIVKDLDEGMKRIYEHSLPLESERAKKAYGAPGSAVNKLLIVNKEVVPNRTTMILVKERLGF
ncbi:MAG: lactate utilization protein [Candidatus Marsarchaeota archaeon]|jgi:L-lactate utilization protein LutC|nr:lactate utilization protein [Candidatus Marsarchaeota archaeon]MCL5111987.1 lactate utilization protein [Candidatus Marsarchaeota archaeon]